MSGHRRGAGVEAIEPILRFMEEHASFDGFGTPGPLTHFVEKFFGVRYEQELVASIQRRPTSHTVWLLKRVMNGTKDRNLFDRYRSILGRARSHPEADELLRNQMERFLK